jgi:MarR family transcriptional regulator, transcriptional regulator for hemolysin
MLQITFGFLLHDTARLLRRDFERRSKGTGLTRAQWAVLAYVARNEGSSQAALADMLDIEPITLVRLLDKLEALGLVERRPDPADRRVRRLFLTAATGPLLEQLQALAAETREAAMVGLTEAERQQLTDLLMKVRGNLTGRDLGVKPPSDAHDATPSPRTAKHA